jgi:hypothetical protein
VLNFTFIKASDGRAMVKKITNSTTTNYPMVKLVDSHITAIKDEDEDDWPEQLTAILKEEATTGSALMKGNFNKILKRESRAGQSDKTAGTRLLVIDVDGLQLPGWTVAEHFSEEELQRAAGAVMMAMPPFLRDSSYVVNASASLGIKAGINLHLFLILDDEISPKTLKTFLVALNFHANTIRSQTHLAASGLTLTFPIDRTLADNSRIIYIGTPEFSVVRDPVPERFTYKKSRKKLVKTSEITRYMKDIKVGLLIKDRVAEIREEEGLPAKEIHTFAMNDADGHRQRVIANPDKTNLVFVAEDEHYVRFNLGKGDSAAYWIHRRDPRLVHNFKGEQPFLYEQADPEGYKNILDHCNVAAKEENVHMAVVDVEENKYKLIRVNINSMRLVKQPTVQALQILSNNMQSYGQDMPEPIPACEIVFAPNDPRGVDLDNHFINSYTTPPLLLKEAQIDEIYKECPYELSSKALSTLCPTIHKVLYSFTGSSIEDYHHFVNWLASIVQEKKKTGTAWLFHGAQGTGKGVFYHNVMKPILTDEYTKMATQETLDDSFTGWMKTKMLVACDEVSYSNSRRDVAKLQKLKNLITEKEGSLRGMHSLAESTNSFTNWMFFTNNRDSMPIDDNDRRFNICQRQETPFEHRYIEYARGGNLPIDLEKEAPFFATFLNHFELDKAAARRPLQSQSKSDMVDSTRTPISSIARIVTHGDIAPLLSIMEAVPSVNDETLLKAQQILRTVILHMQPDLTGGGAKCSTEYISMNIDQLRVLYVALSGTQLSTPQFNTSLRKFGGATTRKISTRFRPSQPERGTNAKLFRGYQIHWKTNSRDVVDEIKTWQHTILHEIYGQAGGFPEWINELLAGGYLEFEKPNIP